ncbi:hypothetical protein CYCD_08430 [Tenuifilaceae bacterium CYCD]|nr:hypothetical protein CYCD_08430 [Tenuifilaceae bacterium CYCD]
MKIAFGLGHPAHFHLYKNAMQILKKDHEILIFISDKDILKKLLDSYNFKYTIIAQTKPNEGLLAKANKLFFSTNRIYRELKNNKPDLFVTCLSQLSWVSFLLNRKCIFNAEDDITYTYLQGIITYPFVSTILSAKVVKTWPFSFKKIGYAGYHKLAYLHPNWFTPDESVKNFYIKDKKYFIIRTVNQNAYHDINARGLDLVTLRNIVDYLNKLGMVYISTEKALPKEFERHILNIKEKDIHHILYFADLFIGDSQSMAVECAMLGTPSIRINNFANKISIINELEYRYQLTHSLSPKSKEKIVPLIQDIFKINRDVYRDRRNNMLKEKIDVTAFYVWFIENYPQSVKIMKNNPDYQNNFK